MSTKTVTRVAPYDLVTAGIVSAVEHKRLWDDEQLGDFDRDHMAALASVVTIQSTALAAPKVNEIRLDTSTTPATLREYDGTTERALGVDYATAQPLATVVGTRWYDSSIGELRVYQTKHAVTGWHPESNDYGLFTNSSGSLIAAGTVASLSWTTGLVTLHSASVKAHTVDGVVVADIAIAGQGLVALATGHAIVDVLVDEGTHTVAASDYLAQSGDVGGQARAVGSGPAFVGTENTSAFGLPGGSFGQALASSSGGLVSMKMQGEVGKGSFQNIDGTGVTALVDDGTPKDVEFTGWFDAKHEPALALRVAFEFKIETGVSTDGVLTLYNNSDAEGATDVWQTFSFDGYASPTTEQKERHHLILDLVTHIAEGATTTTAPGDFFTYMLTSVAFSVANYRVLGYLH